LRTVQLTEIQKTDFNPGLLEKEYEFDGGFTELRREAERLREPVRNGLMAKLLKDPDMEAEEIRACIEDLADESL
jgi:hypothetical protein